MYGKFFIYALIDPISELAFYIGRSKNTDKRYNQHLLESERYEEYKRDVLSQLLGLNKSKKKINRGKAQWIKSITDRDMMPRIEVIDEWECETLDDANRLEDAWIAHYRHHEHPLQNKIISRRMNWWWYTPQNKMWKEGYAQSPQEYIEMLKSGIIGNKDKSDIPNKRYYKRKRQYQNRNINTRVASTQRTIRKK
jgi:hypothetical protein